MTGQMKRAYGLLKLLLLTSSCTLFQEGLTETDTVTLDNMGVRAADPLCSQKSM